MTRKRRPVIDRAAEWSDPHEQKAREPVTFLRTSLRNPLMGTRGARFEDRYHEHVLKTPSEARNALLYVIGNRAVHLARWGKVQRADVDRFSSLASEELIRPPESWMLTNGWLGTR